MPRLQGWPRSGAEASSCRAMRVGWIVFLLATCGCGTSQEAQPGTESLSIQVMGLKSNQMQYHVSQQEASNWCWAACVQMVLSAQGISISQSAVVANASKGLVWDRPGTPGDVLANLNGRIRDSQGKVVTLRTTAISGAPSFEQMQHQFDQGLPLIVGFSIPGQDVGHAAVVTAVIYEWREGHPCIHKVLVRDPSPWLRGSGGKREFSRDEFQQIFVHYLVIPQ